MINGRLGFIRLTSWQLKWLYPHLFSISRIVDENAFMSLIPYIKCICIEIIITSALQTLEKVPTQMLLSPI